MYDSYVITLPSLPPPAADYANKVYRVAVYGYTDTYHICRQKPDHLWEWVQISFGTSVAYSEVQDEGVALPVQSRLNFIGSGVAAVDNPANNRTDVTITAGLPTVSDTSSIDLTMAGTVISADAIFGTTAGTVAQGNDARFHSAVTVTDSSSIDLTLTGQNISAAAIFGTTAGTVAEGNHTHAIPISVSDTASIDLTLAGSVLSAAAIFGSTSGTVAQGNDARFHAAATVTDTASINLTLTGQDISAAAIFGTTAGTVAEGNHTHGGGAEATTVSDTSSINLTLTGVNITADAIFGTTSGTVAQGNDSRFHSPVTVTDTASINLTLTGQDISADAIFGTTATTIAAGNHSHANDHVAATVLDSASIDMGISGQQITAAAIFGSTATTIAAGNHGHTFTVAVNFLIGDGTNAITTGIKGDVLIPHAGTITKWTLLADASGSIVVDLWKDTYANYPPVVGDTITASAKPTISASTKGQSSTLTGWTTSVTAGDIIRVNVDSASTVKRVTLILEMTRTI